MSCGRNRVNTPDRRLLRRLATPATAIFVISLVIMTTRVNSDSNLAAVPISGAAPLEVTFTGTGVGILEGVMQLDFGDGQSDSTISPIRDFTRKHTYTAAGSYTAQLKGGPWGGPRPTVLATLATVTINVH
jgi:hypothetical protein